MYLTYMKTTYSCACNCQLFFYAIANYYWPWATLSSFKYGKANSHSGVLTPNVTRFLGCWMGHVSFIRGAFP
jgi:hypothetical protein